MWFDHPAFFWTVVGVLIIHFIVFLGYAAKVLMDEDVSSPEEIEDPHHKLNQ